MHPGGGVQSSGGSMGSPKPGRKSSWDRDRAGEGGERASQRSSPWTFHGAEELDLSSQSFLWGLEWIVLSWDRVHAPALERVLCSEVLHGDSP